MARESGELKESVFSVCADIKSAHRLVKVARRDWGLMACRSDSTSTTVWLNTVGIVHSALPVPHIAILVEQTLCFGGPFRWLYFSQSVFLPSGVC